MVQVDTKAEFRTSLDIFLKNTGQPSTEQIETDGKLLSVHLVNFVIPNSLQRFTSEQVFPDLQSVVTGVQDNSSKKSSNTTL